MGKGGGGGGGTVNIRNIPGLYNNQPVDSRSLIGGLQGLTQEETAFLNQQGGINSMFQTGENEWTQPWGALGTNPWGEESLGLLQEQQTAGQFGQGVQQANNLAAYGTGQFQGMYGQLPGEQAATAAAQAGVGGYQNQVGQYQQQVRDYQNRVTGAEQQVTDLEQGTGLYRSQQAYVDQAVHSGQAAVQQQLASEGLTSSTQNAMLQNQVAQSGAATAGQLMQGNIQLAQAGVGQAQQDVQLAQGNVGLAQQNVGLQQQNVQQSMEQQQLTQQGIQLGQQLAMGEQGLSLSNLQGLTAMWSNIAQQAGGANQQAFAQAATGAGTLGAFFNQIGQTYGVEIEGMKVQLAQELGQAKLNTDLQTAEINSASSGKSTLGQGLGSILGKSGGGGGGGGGGFLGALGGLFGGGSAALGAGGAAAGTGSALAAGGTAAGLGESLGALAAGLACVVAREVYGADNPKWLQFRSWFLAHSPRWFILFYMEHGFKFAAFIRDKPRIKKAIRSLMDFCLR